MRNRKLGWTLVAGMLAVVGCSTVTARSASEAYVRDAMRNQRFPKACDELWLDALQVIAGEGFGLVGKDRTVTGQDQQGVVTNFLNRGHSTTKDSDGTLESESDANSQMFRYLVRGKLAGSDGCFVQYTHIHDDRVNGTETRNRDYDMELKLLARVDPLAASKILQAADAK
ncbi:MAG: hypothetical protein WCK73_04710 [Deltaproteobacteria bacterium]